MIDVQDRILGFIPEMGTLLIAISMVICLLILQRVNDWVNEKLKLPYMEETNLQQRKMLEQRKESE
ncbi:hypothetical protein AWH56_001220 [Anaerobacillus isosaccharinicus]|uniref:Uncharacterized protein n=1 Tax=Anaerobacillus isosaccharinicus TaxID=1532552 RepID=A0A1S2KVA0_9BACI|nr:hypothetical protein [Anaerobacillus isosaccharinicus]MBA5585327.1 hypothetical protein [Anaerobacillus isosaccharinicus]QOY36347.1 hypothetical protein AWH56_001220 [Anaerobacillus isosaccharinicus]